MVLFLKELPGLWWKLVTGCCSLGILIFKNTCQMQLDTQGAAAPKSHFISHSAITPKFLIITSY